RRIRGPGGRVQRSLPVGIPRRLAADRQDRCAAVGRRAGAARADCAGYARPVQGGVAMITVLKAGPELLVQDLGRPGHAAIGVSPSGALDARALRAANRLVANPESAAGLELLLGGAVLQFDDDAVVALTGAFGEVSVAGRSTERYRPFRIKAGQRLEIGLATSGLRYYLAVAG